MNPCSSADGDSPDKEGFLPCRGLAMMYSKRGLGKTHIAMGMSAAIATGSSFLKWKAPKARRVLYIEGELPGDPVQRYFTDIVAGMNLGADYHLMNNLTIITRDKQARGIPDLATVDGQEAVEEWLKDGIELLVLDNLSALVRAVKENEREGWLFVQDWLIGLRSQHNYPLCWRDEERVVELTEECRQLVTALRKGKQPEDFLFTRENGEAVKDFREAWDALTKAAGVPGLLFHDLRRSAARNMVRRGVPQKTAREITGHKTDAVFSRYNIVSPDDIRDAAKKIEEGAKAAVSGSTHSSLIVGTEEKENQEIKPS